MYVYVLQQMNNNGVMEPVGVLDVEDVAIRWSHEAADDEVRDYKAFQLGELPD